MSKTTKPSGFRLAKQTSRLDLPRSLRDILREYVTHLNPKDPNYPQVRAGQPRIAALSGYSRTTVKAATQRLIELGYLALAPDCDRKGGRAIVNRLLVDYGRIMLETENWDHNWHESRQLTAEKGSISDPFMNQERGQFLVQKGSISDTKRVNFTLEKGSTVDPEQSKREQSIGTEKKEQNGLAPENFSACLSTDASASTHPEIGSDSDLGATSPPQSPATPPNPKLHSVQNPERIKQLRDDLAHLESMMAAGDTRWAVAADVTRKALAKAEAEQRGQAA